MDVGGGNPGRDARFDQNIYFGCGILIKTEDCDVPIDSGC